MYLLLGVCVWQRGISWTSRPGQPVRVQWAALAHGFCWSAVRGFCVCARCVLVCVCSRREKRHHFGVSFSIPFEEKLILAIVRERHPKERTLSDIWKSKKIQSRENEKSRNKNGGHRNFGFGSTHRSFFLKFFFKITNNVRPFHFSLFNSFDF